ncbi:unnamed protein product [Sphenostylis stenocarpa]|uniref:Uncharacterized protein n=1 Tax=Sphenostylis stenocarpa TaxID=92480 RepID=A0AA86W1A7_9FABA|nr:unnamed protein product [Sphenostylis stenocarpa]
MMSQHPPKNLSTKNKPAAPKAVEPSPSNRLLAGYLAHEFLTKGTLLGRRFELDSVQAEPKRSQLNSQAAEVKSSAVQEHGSYEEVANLLKTKGTYIKGIVNPTQLSNWINM